MKALAAHERGAATAALVVLTAIFAWRLSLSRQMRFGPDEMEHLHAAWSVSQGSVPYRDFFEHHPPALYAVLAPAFHLIDVSTSFAQAWTFMCVARVAFWLLALAATALAYTLGRLWRGTLAGVLGAVLLASGALFVDRTTELRPDGPGLVLLLLAAVAWVAADRVPPTAAARRRFLLSGVCLGLGLLFTQKQLFVWPAFGLAALHRIVFITPRRRAIGDALLFAAGVALPLALIALVYLRLGALRELVYYTFLLNVGWKTHASPLNMLLHAVAEAPHLWSFGLVGLSGLIASRRRLGDACDVLMASLAAGALLGLALLPISYRQYYLLIVAPLAVIAGAALSEAIESARGGARSDALRSWSTRRALGAALVAVALPPLLGEPPRWITAALVALALLAALRREGGWAPAALVAALALDAAAPLHALALRTNVERETEMRLVHLNSWRCDTVLDGFNGSAAFRPHASFFYFVHGEIQSVLGTQARGAMAPWLEGGAEPPHVVILDGQLTSLEPRLATRVAREYRPAALGSVVRVHVFDGTPPSWRDDDVRPLVRATCHRPAAVLVGDGWEEPGDRLGVRYLHTRGERAVLGLPLQHAASGSLALRLRAEGAPAARARLLVNGHVAGGIDASADWSEPAFPVDASWWDPQANEVTLRLLDGGRLAVEWIRFDPAR